MALISYDAEDQRAPVAAEAKRRLNAVRSAERDLSAITYELEHLQAMRTKITAALQECTTNGSKTADARTEATARLVDMERQLYAKITDFDAAVKAAKSEIMQLKSEKQRAVTYRRYILNWSWGKIAADLELSPEAVYRLHGRALRNLDQIYKAGA